MNLQKIREEYRNREDELDEVLKNIRLQDLADQEAHKAFLLLLREFRQKVKKVTKKNGTNFYEQLRNFLSVGEDGIYSKKSRFIYELIQNVDDCDYIKSEDAQLSVHFDIEEGVITLSYNETGFTPFNVFAITGIAEAAKNTGTDKIEIGEKGIGFKSVFGVADKVLIQSGYFSFHLTKEEYTIPQPHYPEDFCHVQGTRLTLYVGHKEAEQLYNELLSSYQDEDILLNQNPLLFLNKLTDLCFYIDKSFRYIRFHVDRNMPKNTETELRIEENVQISFACCDKHLNNHEPISKEMQCIRYTKQITYSREMYQSRYGNDAERDKIMYLSILFPDADYAYTAKGGRLYSFLPTELSLCVPLVCHIPFKLNASRESVDSQGENAWFRHSISEFSEMLKEAYQDLAKRLKEDAIAYLPRRKQFLFVSDKTELRKAELKGETFLTLPVFYTAQEHLKGIDDIVCVSPKDDISDPVRLHHLIGGQKELFLLPEKQKDVADIMVMRDIPKKLFRRAMQYPELTEEILQLLSGMKNVLYDELIKEMEPITLTITQIHSVFACEKCWKAFNNNGRDKIKTVQQIHVSVSPSETVDVRQAFDEPIEADDFGENAEKYLHRIKFRCIQLEDIQEKGFLICRNVLVLSKNIESLKEFCRMMDDDDMLAARLQFRTASKKLDAADDAMSPLAYLKLLTKIRKNSIGGDLQRRFIELINESGMDEHRFINELLQNADDAVYYEDTKPEFRMTIQGTELKTSCNEKGFTKLDVRSITAIGESTKKLVLANGSKPTGEKGIGFKSVFKVADEVEIRSGAFGFTLTAKQPTVPKILENYTPIESGTEMIFRLRTEFTEDVFSKTEILQLCLCLRKLRRIHLGNYDVTIEDDGENRIITIDQELFSFRKIEYEFHADPLALQMRREDNPNISEEQQIILYVPKNKALDTYHVYSVLPTKVKCKVPLVIDAPFMLTTAREHIMQNEWNDCIKDQMYKAILCMIDELKKSEGIKVLRFLKVKFNQSCYSDNLFSDPYLNGILLDSLKNRRFLPSYEEGSYVSPSEIQRAPAVLVYLLEKNAGTESLRHMSLKGRCDEYFSQLHALGITEMSVSSVMEVITENYTQYITEKKFRELLYTYLSESTDKLKQYSDQIRLLRMIPVKGKAFGSVEYVAYSDKVYFKDGVELSPQNCWLLDTEFMSVEQFDKIFGVRIKEYDEIYEINDYREELWRKLLIKTPVEPERTYEYLLREYRENYNIFSKCKNVLCHFFENAPFSIPLKNELGEVVCRRLYVSDVPKGYYFGQLLPGHIAHPECMELARFLGCKNIRESHPDGLKILSDLTADDIEDLQDESLLYGYEIIAHFLNTGKISNELIQQYQLSGFISSTNDLDDFEWGAPVDEEILQKIRESIHRKPLEIIKKEVTRTVQFIRFADGRDELLSNQQRREDVLYRYSYNKKRCICQMCLTARPEDLIEVNNIQKHPKYYWKECGLSLCLNCSKQFELLRNQESVYLKFLKDIRNADICDSGPIRIGIGNSEITFSQTHLACVQEILKYEDELNEKA